MASRTYPVSTEDMRTFTLKELDEFKRTFRAFDEDGNGSIDKEELAKVMQSLGENVSTEEVAALIAEVDDDASGTVEFSEFLKVRAPRDRPRHGPDFREALHRLRCAPTFHAQVMRNMRSGAGSRSSAKFERVVTKKAALIEVKSKSGGAHSFSETEKVCVRAGGARTQRGPRGTRSPLGPCAVIVAPEMGDAPVCHR